MKEVAHLSHVEKVAAEAQHWQLITRGQLFHHLTLEVVLLSSKASCIYMYLYSERWRLAGEEKTSSM